MAAAVARHLVKVDPENPGAWLLKEPAVTASIMREANSELKCEREKDFSMPASD